MSTYLVVRDLGSTNGIRINGVRVLEGRLKGGDELTIGGHRYQVSWDALATPAARPDAAVRAKFKAAPPVPPARPDDDALLEACDEPIPLRDPADSLPLEPAAPPAPPAPVVKDVVLPIVPEHLELASGSDADGPPRRPS